VGAYYIAGSVMIHLAVEYAFLFSNLPEPDLEDLELTKVSGVAQEEEESTDEKASYLSFLLGVNIPLGGN
jgi:hypothetical protein